MNWSRGLFRAWLVVSVLWAALCIGWNWSTLASSLSEVSCLIGDASARPACVYHNMGYVSWGLEDRQFWLTLATPPLVILLLGYAVLWVGRGFRRPENVNKS